ncbi:MAG TPA: histidine triad nucleotide-binding protein [Acidimicrobiales bacterium]|nr:histidine triad nucleotide-binding protein [Acidimicrobiales bacterium]
MNDCLFCRVVRGEVPSTKVAESEVAYAFRDVAPVAPVHVLVVPKSHVVSAHDVGPDDAHLLGELVLLAQEVARLEGIDGEDRGYRLVMNVGKDANMSVPHLHLHVLGGRAMGWPPG